jgi:hypothetical protein
MDERCRENYRPYEELTEELKFLKRYLKEHGAYVAYKRNIRNKRCFNGWQKCTPMWAFKDAVEFFGVRPLISRLMVWTQTKEGWGYWNTLCEHFYQSYDETFGHKK